MLTRRGLLKGVGAFVVSGFGLGGYALGYEPYRLLATRYELNPADWPKDLALRIAVVADLHACDPWMPVERIEAIVAATNAHAPDLVVLLGDFEASHRFVMGHVPKRDWAKALSQLEAPLGVHAVLGNHDWWSDDAALARRAGPVANRLALEAAGIPVYENDAVRLVKSGQTFWLAGLGDQWALWPRSSQHRRNFPHRWYEGVDDLPSVVTKIGSGSEPVILMAHEPDIFPEVPDRISVTLSGHTHGGQVQFFGYAPKVPSRFGQRYVYGHVIEGNRHLVVSGGLGCSGAPIRFGRPPEVVIIDLGAAAHNRGAVS